MTRETYCWGFHCQDHQQMDSPYFDKGIMSASFSCDVAIDFACGFSGNIVIILT